MPRIHAVQSAIQPRYESSDEDNEDLSDGSAEDVQSDIQSEEGSEDEEPSGSGSEEEDNEADTANDLKDISFGALAKAQAALTSNPRKRKRPDVDAEADEERPTSSSTRPSDPRDNDRFSREPPPSRTSKHAPTIISSKKPVSRRREIFSPPPALKSRDPRFDASVLADASRGNRVAATNADRNYAFLSDYQASEVLDLKSQIKKTKDPDQQAELKRKLMSIEAKLRNAQTRKREAEILLEHKRGEKADIREGRKQKAYFLKPSEVKRRIDQERKDGMGKKARDKADKRRQKREKGKEGREMPRARRSNFA